MIPMILAATQILTCHTTDKSCESAVLGRVVFDTVGALGHHSEYRVNATLKVIKVSKARAGSEKKR